MSSQAQTVPASAELRPYAAVAVAMVIITGAALVSVWVGPWAPRPILAPVCTPAPGVSEAQVNAAAAALSQASRRAQWLSLNGSPYVAAKVGLPRSSPEHALALAAAADAERARKALAALCTREAVI